MKPIDRAAAIAFIVSGAMLVAWGLFSILGTLVGAMIGAAGVVTMDEEMLIGVPIFLIYGLWVLICLVVGPVQLAAGIKLYQGQPKGGLTWAATFGGLVGTMTFYCAPPALVAFGLGLACMLSQEDAEA